MESERMSKYIQTMKDLEAATYGYGSTLGGNIQHGLWSEGLVDD